MDIEAGPALTLADLRPLPVQPEVQFKVLTPKKKLAPAPVVHVIDPLIPPPPRPSVPVLIALVGALFVALGVLLLLPPSWFTVTDASLHTSLGVKFDHAKCIGLFVRMHDTWPHISPHISTGNHRGACDQLSQVFEGKVSMINHVMCVC